MGVALRSNRPLTLDELELIYRRDGAAFERVAIAIVGDEHLGCDVVQTAFVHAVRNRTRYEPRAPVEAWLWRIVVNEARKQRVREAGIVAVEPDALDLGAPPTAGTADRDQVRRAIAALPDRQRLMLFLRHYADLDYATIAQVLEVKPGTVGAALHAAHERLRADLQEVHECED